MTSLPALCRWKLCSCPALKYHELTNSSPLPPKKPGERAGLDAGSHLTSASATQGLLWT